MPMCVIQCGLREACRHYFFLPFEGPEPCTLAFESEHAKALIVGEERQQPVGPFDDFVDPPWSLLFSQISCGFR